MCTTSRLITHSSTLAITLSPIHNSYRIPRYTILPKPTGFEAAFSKMKQRTIYHSIIEPGRIRFYRHGVPRITLSDIDNCAPRSCRDCASGSTRFRIPCSLTTQGYEARVALRVRYFSQSLYTCILIPTQDTFGTIHMRSSRQANDYVTICEVYKLAWELVTSTLADSLKKVSSSVSTVTLILIRFRLLVATQTHPQAFP